MDEREEPRQDLRPTAVECGREPAPAFGLPVGAQPVRLLLISDIRILREGLGEVLVRDGTFEIVGTAADLGEALVAIAATPPHLILVDAALPNGLTTVRRLREHRMQSRIVVFALTESEADVIAWAEAGVSGYVPRNVALAQLVGFVAEIARGQQVCSTRVAARLLRWISQAPERGPMATPQPGLTAREEEVVRLVSTGLSNKEIARRLNIGLATAKSHVHNVLCKLNLESRGQVARWTRDHGPVFGQW
jgi:DNA-binding NarL/FixJ family response regulator